MNDSNNPNTPEPKPNTLWYLSLMINECGQVTFLVASLLSLGWLSVPNLIIGYGVWKTFKSKKMTIFTGNLNGGGQDNAVIIRNIKSGVKFLILSVLIVLSNNYIQ